MFYIEQAGLGSAFLELAEAHILKMFPPTANQGGIFHDFNVCIWPYSGYVTVVSYTYVYCILKIFISDYLGKTIS